MERPRFGRHAGPDTRGPNGGDGLHDRSGEETGKAVPGAGLDRSAQRVSRAGLGGRAQGASVERGRPARVQMPRHLRAGCAISYSNPFNVNQRVAPNGTLAEHSATCLPLAEREQARVIRRQDPLTLHHFKAGVEFVAALGAAHTVALDRPLFAGHRHATAVRTASYLDGLAIQRLELRPAETVHVLSVKLPGLPCVVHDGQGDVMVGGVVLQLLSGLEPVLDQLVGLRIIQSVPLHYYFGRPKLHGAPPDMPSFFGM